MGILLIIGVLVGLTLCGCSESGVDCDAQSQSVQWDLDTLAVAQEVAVNGIWGVNPAEVYAVGMVDSGQGPTGVVWKYDGTSWAEFYTRPNTEFRDIHGVSAQSLWIAGFNNPVDSWGQALVLHWDGNNWEESLLDPSVAGLLAIWASDDQNVYAVDRRHGTVMHYDGAIWVEEETPVKDDPPSSLFHTFDVWGVREGDSLVVYAALALGPGSNGVLLRKSSLDWVIDFLAPGISTPGTLVGVWGGSAEQVYTVEQTGKGPVPYGKVYHRGDATWEETSFGRKAGLFRGVRGSANGALLVFGAGIYVFQDGTWTDYSDYPGFPYYLSNDVWIDGHVAMFATSYGNSGGILVADFAVSCQDSN